jgi:hypothetical protein
VRAPEDNRVDAGGEQGVEIGLRQAQHLPAAGHAALHEVDETGAGGAGDRQPRDGGESVLVGATGDGGLRADHADPAVARGRGGPSHRRQDHLDHGDVVALAGISQRRGAGGVAGDDEHLHAVGDQPVHDGERVPADLRDRQRAVRSVRRVPDVADRLVRQLVEYRTGDGEPADPRVEDADRCIGPAQSAHRGPG